MARPVAALDAAELPGRLQQQPRRHPLYLDDISARTAWADLGLLLLLLVAMVVGLSIIGGLILELAPGVDERWLKTGMLPVQALAATGGILLILALRRQRIATVGLTGARIGVNLLLGPPTAAAGAGTHLFLVLMLMIIEPGMQYLAEENSVLISEMLPRMHPAVMIALMIVVGFYEELLFRGFLLTRLRKATGSWWIAVVVSSLVFAAPHMAEQADFMVVSLFGLGVVFSVVTIWRKSLVPAIVGHAIFNTGNLLVMYSIMPEWK